MTDQYLEALLGTHADALRALLPASLWPINPFKVEQFGPLTKYTLGQLPNGRWAMLHRLTEPDHGPPHDHPVEFLSRILVGGYVERIWLMEAGKWISREVERKPGEYRSIPPDCVHQIIALPAGDCWSLCYASPVVHDWRHYPELLQVA